MRATNALLNYSSSTAEVAYAVGELLATACVAYYDAVHVVDTGSASVYSVMPYSIVVVSVGQVAVCLCRKKRSCDKKPESQPYDDQSV